jgi:hypothetical protein
VISRVTRKVIKASEVVHRREKQGKSGNSKGVVLRGDKQGKDGNIYGGSTQGR